MSPDGGQELMSSHQLAPVYLSARDFRFRRRHGKGNLVENGEAGVRNQSGAGVDSRCHRSFHDSASVVLFVVLTTSQGIALYHVYPLIANEHRPAVIWVVGVIIAALSAILLPTGPFSYPHWSIGRISLGLHMAYLGLLLAGLTFSAGEIRAALEFVSPALQDSSPVEKVYAEDCRLHWHIIAEKLDVFIFMHFFGYVAKAVAIRSSIVAWATSIFWEVTEICLSGLLANFRECWWDIIVLDILLCNGLGILAGLRICHWFGLSTYKWGRLSLSGNVRLHRNSLLGRYLAILALTVYLQVADLNIFLLKHIFVVPTSHPFIIGKQIVYFLVGVPTVRQYYQLMTERRRWPGLHFIVVFFSVVAELLLCVKVGNLPFWSSVTLAQAVLWILTMILGSMGTLAILIRQSKSDSSSISQVVDTSLCEENRPPHDYKGALCHEGHHLHNERADRGKKRI